METTVIGVDFDGTVVLHEYPLVGPNVEGAVEVLKKLIANKHKIILWTMRSGEQLQDAIDWYAKHEIPLYGINQNPDQVSWTMSPKAYANIYIDDASICCPLLPNEIKNGKPFVDWGKIEEMLALKGLIDCMPSLKDNFVKYKSDFENGIELIIKNKSVKVLKHLKAEFHSALNRKLIEKEIDHFSATVSSFKNHCRFIRTY